VAEAGGHQGEKMLMSRQQVQAVLAHQTANWQELM
jgi:hypothetical protein